MDTEDIDKHWHFDRHWHNWKVFSYFLRTKKKYVFFKRRMFIDKKRSLLDLFDTINKTNVEYISPMGNFNNEIDRKWSSILTFVPFCGFYFYWPNEKLDCNDMYNLAKEWSIFLKEHNYDKFKNRYGNFTFEFD